MKKIHLSLIYLALSLAINPALALVPDIGDNSLIKCAERRFNENSNACFGELQWVSDAQGQDQGLEVLPP